MTAPQITASQLQALQARAPGLALSPRARERLSWVLCYFQSGESASAVCRRFDIGRGTFYRALRRFDPARPETLEDRPTRPHTVRPAVEPAGTVALIRAYRESRPRAGKHVIASLLRGEHGIRLTPSAVAAVIEREGLYFADTPLHRRKRMEREAGKAAGGACGTEGGSTCEATAQEGAEPAAAPPPDGAAS